MQDINPRNRGKTKISFFLRKIEDQIKNFFLLLIVFFSFFFPVKSKGKKVINLNNYVDIYSINYITFSLFPSYRFTYNLKACLPLIKRLGVKFFYLYCKPNFMKGKNNITICYNKKKELDSNEINFNFDYFLPFDKNNFSEIDLKKSFILPYYTRAEFYKKNFFKKFKNLRDKKKLFHIVFSGSNHPDWYEQFKWQINKNTKERILTRCEILEFVKKEFKKEVQVINKKNDISKIDYNKKIFFFISDPSKKRKASKILSTKEHIELIASAKFFLTAPGTAMPLCHHLVESMFLGTIPITPYGDLLFPKLDNGINSLNFKSYSELYNCIDKALSISDNDSEEMRANVLDYYEKNLSHSSFLNNFQTFKLPINLYMNIDGHTLDSRRERFGLPRLFPLPKS